MKKRGQSSFAAGAFAAEAPSMVPTIGALDLLNFVLDDEGSLRRRGGCTYVSDADASLTTLPLGVWNGVLQGGQRTVWAGPNGMWTLQADGHTPERVQASMAWNKPPQFLEIAGMVIVNRADPLGGFPGSTAAAYGGSHKAAYSTGTISITKGSTTVTGVGTAWAANVDPGMLLLGATGIHVVKSVDSNTQLTLRDPYYDSTVAAVAYSLARAFPLPAIYPFAGHAALWGAVAGRLIYAQDGARFQFTDGPDPASGALRPFQTNALNVHDLPAGADLICCEAIRDRLFVFTTRGVFVISNMAYEIVGPDASQQHRVEHYSRDVIALGSGITTFGDSLIVPAADDIYLLDGLSTPEPITRSARRDWRSLVRQGAVPGSAAIFRGHYVCPTVSSAGTANGTWLFRLDRPVEVSTGVVYPWTRWGSQGGNLGGVAVQEGAARRLLGGGFASSGGARGRVVDSTPGFDIGATNSSDADGNAVVAVLTTRDFVGAGLRTLWRYLRARYRLSDSGGAATVAAEVSPGGDTAIDFASLGTGGEFEAARSRFTWPFQRMAEYVRFRFTVSGGDEFVLHELEAEFEEPGL